MSDLKSEEKSYLISVNENNLARTINWVSVIDSKAVFVLTIVLAVFGFLIAQFERSALLLVKLWTIREYTLALILAGVLLVTVFFLAKSLVYLLIVIYPKRTPYTQQNSLFFYDTIAKMVASDFSREMESIKPVDTIRGLSDQTYNLSKVVFAKFDQLSISIKAFAIGLGALILFMALEAILSSIFL